MSLCNWVSHFKKKNVPDFLFHIDLIMQDRADVFEHITGEEDHEGQARWKREPERKWNWRCEKKKRQKRCANENESPLALILPPPFLCDSFFLFFIFFISFALPLFETTWWPWRVLIALIRLAQLEKPCQTWQGLYADNIATVKYGIRVTERR